MLLRKKKKTRSDCHSNYEVNYVILWSISYHDIIISILSNFWLKQKSRILLSPVRWMKQSTICWTWFHQLFKLSIAFVSLIANQIHQSGGDWMEKQGAARAVVIEWRERETSSGCCCRQGCCPKKQNKSPEKVSQECSVWDDSLWTSRCGWWRDF